MNTRIETIRRKLRADFLHYAEKCLSIRSKEGRIRRMKLNSAQVYLHQTLEEQKRKTGKVRALILKGRQQGCSTYVQARFYWKVTHQRGARAFILTHLEEASRNLYQIVRRFHDHCPELVKPHTGFSNSRELVFDKLDSGYAIGTAKSQGVGRSNTLQYFHGSEVAYWAHAAEHISGILQAVPDADDTEIILESTSAGADGQFYKMCEDAMHGRSEYMFVFIPWFWQEEYRKSVPEDFIASAEEESLKHALSIDDAQILWRRTKIHELGSVWTFQREYPSTPDEAFRTDLPGALWTRQTLQKNRKAQADLPEMSRIVVAIDPAVSAHAGSDETGIIVAGLGTDGHGYVLEDLSGVFMPAQWAMRAADAYHRFGADCIVAETNQGGDMVENTIRAIDPVVSYKSVHATRGKIVRAEPVAAFDTRGMIHHAGHFTTLEDQMCRFDRSMNGPSPDRVDARVWAFTELMLKRKSDNMPRLWR